MVSADRGSDASSSLQLWANHRQADQRIGCDEGWILLPPSIVGIDPGPVLLLQIDQLQSQFLAPFYLPAILERDGVHPSQAQGLAHGVKIIEQSLRPHPWI